MVLYEVNLQIDPQIKDQFYPWLKKHIQEMLELEYFSKADIFFDEDSDENSINYVCHYYAENLDQLNNYFNKDAERMRKEGMELFSQQMKATRRILKHLTRS